MHERKAFSGGERIVKPHFECLIEEILCGELVVYIRVINVLVDVVIDVVVWQYWRGKALDLSFMEVVEKVWVLIGISQ